MSGFDAALAKGGTLVAAWDDFDDDRETLALFEVGAAGAKLLAETKVPREQQPQRADELAARGLRVGYTVGNNEHVWVIDDRRATVWTKQAVSELAPPSGVVRVVAFVDEADRGHRGVALVTGGGRVVAAEEHDSTAADDPFYNADNLLVDAMWASYLANDLATWLGVPLDDQIMHIDNTSQLQVAKAARALGSVGEVSAGVIKGVGEVKLRRTAGTLEVLAKSASRVIRQGTADQIAAALRSVRLPRLVLDTASALVS